MPILFILILFMSFVCYVIFWYVILCICVCGYVLHCVDLGCVDLSVGLCGENLNYRVLGVIFMAFMPCPVHEFVSFMALVNLDLSRFSFLAVSYSPSFSSGLLVCCVV